MTPPSQYLKALRVELWRGGFLRSESDLQIDQRTLVRPLDVKQGDIVYLIFESSRELARVPFDGTVNRVLP